VQFFKIASQLQIEVDPSFTIAHKAKNGEKEIGGPDTIREIIREGLKAISMENRLPNLARRYSFRVKEIAPGSIETRITLDIVPKGQEKGTEEIAQPDHYMYDYLHEHKGGKTGAILFKTPQEAIDAIPENNNLAYRGMSWEEWKNIEKTGVIQSSGEYNIGQENLTFFSPKAETAAYYASGFAPLAYQVTPKTPGVVIAVDASYMLSHDDRQDIPQGELAVLGPLNAAEIKKIWFLLAVSSRAGMLDLLVPWDVDRSDWTYYLDPSKTREGSRSNPYGGYGIIEKK